MTGSLSGNTKVKHVPVIVVGAGPTGPLVASSLQGER